MTQEYLSLIPNKDPFLSDYFLLDKYKLVLCPEKKGYSWYHVFA